MVERNPKVRFEITNFRSSNNASSCIAPNVLSVLKYHGPKRECITKELLKFDILLTTYATVASEFGQGSGPLYGVTWFRIVLDEGIAHGY